MISLLSLSWNQELVLINVTQILNDDTKNVSSLNSLPFTFCHVFGLSMQNLKLGIEANKSMERGRTFGILTVRFSSSPFSIYKCATSFMDYSATSLPIIANVVLIFRVNFKPKRS